MISSRFPSHKEASWVPAQALVDVGMSEDEYRFIVDQVYKTMWADANKSTDVPPANLALFRKYEADIKKYRTSLLKCRIDQFWRPLPRCLSRRVTLTSVRLLARHLTPDNHQAVLARASGLSRPQIEALVAELAPRPDVPSSVRKLPTFKVTPRSSAPAATSVSSEPTPSLAPSPAALVPTPRPIVRATAPERYRVQFTIGTEGHERLRRLQALLSVPGRITQFTRATCRERSSAWPGGVTLGSAPVFPTTNTRPNRSSALTGEKLMMSAGVEMAEISRFQRLASLA